MEKYTELAKLYEKFSSFGREETKYEPNKDEIRNVIKEIIVEVQKLVTENPSKWEKIPPRYEWERTTKYEWRDDILDYRIKYKPNLNKILSIYIYDPNFLFIKIGDKHFLANGYKCYPYCNLVEDGYSYVNVWDFNLQLDDE